MRQIKREDVLAFYHHRYVPQNMVFVVVGDVDTDAVLADIEEGFRHFQRTTERREQMPVEPDQASPRSARFQMEGRTCTSPSRGRPCRCSIPTCIRWMWPVSCSPTATVPV